MLYDVTDFRIKVYYLGHLFMLVLAGIAYWRCIMVQICAFGIVEVVDMFWLNNRKEHASH